MRIVVLDGYTVNPGDNPWSPLAELGELEVHDRSAPDEVIPRSQGAEVLVINKIRLPDVELDQLPKLRLVAVTATGHDCVDSRAARERGIDVCNVPEYGTDSVAQFVFALILELAHQVAMHDRLVREGQWQAAGDFCFWRTPQIEMVGKTLGIVGWGRIGQRVGQLAQAFGMHIVVSSRAQDMVGAPPGLDWRTIEELFAESDVVSMHCPLTESTVGVVNEALLSKLKPSAFFINTARGGLVVENDLAAALKSGQLAGAAIDVAAQEPISTASPLLDAPNCIITPHIAWATLEARQRMMAQTAQNIGSFQRGQPQNVVN